MLYYTLLDYFSSLFTIPFNTLLYFTILGYTVLYFALLYYTMLYQTILTYTARRCTVLTVLNWPVLYCTVLSPVLHCTVLSGTGLHCTVYYCAYRTTPVRHLSNYPQPRFTKGRGSSIRDWWLLGFDGSQAALSHEVAEVKNSLDPDSCAVFATFDPNVNPQKVQGR